MRYKTLAKMTKLTIIIYIIIGNDSWSVKCIRGHAPVNPHTGLQLVKPALKKIFLRVPHIGVDEGVPPVKEYKSIYIVYNICEHTHIG